MKTCKKCFLEKEIQDFYIAEGTKDGVRSSCKDCDKEEAKIRNKNNPEKQKARNKRYQEDPEFRERASFRRRFRLFGITKENFNNQLKRQNFCCYGCLTPLQMETACVDHCHSTKEVRGLLCRSCNLVLGNAKDSPEILRRLQAYLDYQIDKTNIYLIGALKNKRIPDIGNLLRNQGYDVMDEWFTPGEHADTNWQEYEKKRGRNYRDALRGRAATNIFLFDKSYLDLSDVAILVSPAGKSAAIELGYVKGRGKFTIIFLDELDPDRYDIMPNVADCICKTETELLETLKNYDSLRRHTQTP